jgi:cyclophilin family peptidyl-prolyl cis-trans isomerase/HEAT repeat protein
MTARPDALIVLICLMAMACASGREAELLPSAVEPVQEEDLLQRRAEILMAEDRRIVDDRLLSALESANSDLRAVAVRALGRIGDPTTRAAIEERLRDRDPAVRAAAALALGMIGDKGSLPALISRADDPAATVRRRVAESLGLLADQSAVETILRLLGDEDPDVVAAACYSIPRFQRADFAVPPLMILLRERGREVGKAALRALAWLASDQMSLSFENRLIVRRFLVDQTGSELAAIRKLAAAGLAMPSEAQEAEVLGALLRDPDPLVRVNAVRGLCFPGAPLEPFVSEALKDTDDRVVLAAVQGLGRMRGPEMIEALAEVIVHDTRLWLRREAVLMLRQVGPRRAAEVANGLSRDERVAIREASARLLYDRREPLAIEIAKRLFADGNARVRIAAIPALAGADERLSVLLGEHVTASDPRTRVAVADAAGRRLADGDRDEDDHADALDILGSLWNRSVEPFDFDLQIAVMDAAAGAGGLAGTRALLEEGLRSPAQQVRLRAIEAMRELFDEDRSESIGAASNLPIEDYLAILRWAEKPWAARIDVRRPGITAGSFTIRLDTEAAPMAAWNFARLAERGFFNGQIFHRVVPGYFAQSGDPWGDGSGGPGYTIRDEVTASRFEPGTLGMTSPGRDGAGSGWFISVVTQPRLGDSHTAFGMVVQNFAGVVPMLLPGDRIASVTIYSGDGSEEM